MRRGVAEQGKDTKVRRSPIANTYGPRYKAARAGALRRSRGVCQACGRRAAETTHHWALEYPDPDAITADDLIGLCRPCHSIINDVRLLDRAGGNTFKLARKVRELMEDSI